MLILIITKPILYLSLVSFMEKIKSFVNIWQLINTVKKFACHLTLVFSNFLRKFSVLKTREKLLKMLYVQLFLFTEREKFSLNKSYLQNLKKYNLRIKYILIHFFSSSLLLFKKSLIYSSVLYKKSSNGNNLAGWKKMQGTNLNMTCIMWNFLDLKSFKVCGIHFKRAK